MTSALQPVQHIPLLPGIREDVDPVAAPPGTLRDAQNVRFGRAGGIYPRWGTAGISRFSPSSLLTTSMQVSAVGTYAQRRAGYMVAGGVTWFRDDTTTLFTPMGANSTVVPYREFGCPDPQVVSQFLVKYGVAVNSLGFVCYVTNTIQIWSPDGALLWEVINPVYTFSTGGSVVAVGADFIIVQQQGTNLSAAKIQNAGAAGLALSYSSLGTVGTLTNAASGWDVCPASNGTQWYLAFQDTATTLRIDLFTNGTSAANVSQVITNATTSCSVYADANRVWLGWYDDPTLAGSVKHRTFNISTLAAIDPAQTIDTIGLTGGGPPLIGPAVPGNIYGATAFAVWRYSDANTGNPVKKTGLRYRHLIGNSTAGSVKTLWHYTPLSKPDSGSRVWCITGNTETNCATQRAVMVTMYPNVDETNGQPMLACSRKLTESAQGTFHASDKSRVNGFGQIAEFSGKNYFGLPEVLLKGSGLNPPITAYNLVEVRTDTAEPFRFTQGDGETLLVAGQWREFPGRLGPDDPSGPINGSYGATGKGGYETGFAYAPIVLDATEGSGGGSALTVASNYSWIFVFEWVDAYGRLHQSAPSAPYDISPTAVGTTKVTFTVTSLDGSDRHSPLLSSPVKLICYRTKAGQPGTYYRDDSPSNCPTAYSSATGVVTYVSTTADSAIGSNGVLYTDGGVKDNDLAPAARFACLSENRVILGGLFNPYLSQVSKQVFAGFPIEFTANDSWKIAWPEPLTALAYQDGTILGFCDSAIYAVSGDGPDDTGNGTFSTPRALCRDLGCPESSGGWRSVIETSLGVFFRSARGFYLIPRGNGVPVFIGAGVQRMFAPSAYPYCFGAAAFQHGEHRTVRWLLSTGATLGSSTIVAIYDLDVSSRDPNAGWSYDTFANTLGAFGNWPSGLAHIRSTFGSNIGYLEQLNPTFVGDFANNEAITSAIETNDLRLAGPAGFYKLNTCTVLLSGADGTPSVLTCTVTPDGDGASPTAIAYTLPTATGSTYRYLAPASVGCTSARVRLSCVRGSTKRGAAMHALTLEVNPVGGARRTTTAERT